MLLWKGVEFRSMGIIVEETPVISKGKKNIDIYTIPGRSGFLSVDNGTYDSFVVSVSCHFNEKANFDKIKEFLDGYGTVSFDGEREYTGIIQNAISFEKVLMFKKFIVQFLLNPIAEDIEPITIDIKSESEEFNINGATIDMYPILEITGTGDVVVTINNQTFNLYDMDNKFILDCKEKVITSNGVNVANKMLNDFPKLIKGQNTVNYTGNITEFKIIYKRAYL